jgi:hypothetical protein
MRNQKNIGATRSTIQNNLHSTMQAFRDGWNDVYMSRGFRAEYENGTAGYQQNYERGRHACNYAKALGMELKPWRGKISPKMPLYVQRAAYYVVQDFPLQKKAG